MFCLYIYGDKGIPHGKIGTPWVQKENAPVPPNAIMVNFATIVFAVAFGHRDTS